jgi:hypothetical protein
MRFLALALIVLGAGSGFISAQQTACCPPLLFKEDWRLPARSAATDENTRSGRRLSPTNGWRSCMVRDQPRFVRPNTKAALICGPGTTSRSP